MSGGSGVGETRTVFAGKHLSVTIERWRGHEAEIVNRADSVAIVAVDRDGFVTLVRQGRAPAGRDLLELPAGTVEDGEEPLATAKRELAEETGLSGGRWRTGPVFYTTPGFCRERMHVFFADELERGDANPDEDEDVELVRLPVSELRERVAEIEDAKTLVGLLLYAFLPDDGSVSDTASGHP